MPARSPAANASRAAVEVGLGRLVPQPERQERVRRRPGGPRRRPCSARSSASSAAASAIASSKPSSSSNAARSAVGRLEPGVVGRGLDRGPLRRARRSRGRAARVASSNRHARIASRIGRGQPPVAGLRDHRVVARPRGRGAVVEQRQVLGRGRPRSATGRRTLAGPRLEQVEQPAPVGRRRRRLGSAASPWPSAAIGWYAPTPVGRVGPDGPQPVVAGPLGDRPGERQGRRRRRSPRWPRSRGRPDPRR